MTTAKTVNYTSEMTATVVADYKAGLVAGTDKDALLKGIAEATGKSVRSIVAKLSREGVYEKKEYVGKTGEAVVTKAELVAEIAEKLGVPAEDVGSLEAATKAVLKAVAAAL